MTDPYLTDAVLAAARQLGWTRAALAQAAGGDALVPGAFPRGIAGAIAAWCSLVDTQMDAGAAAEDLEALRVPARIRRVMEIRLRLVEDDRELLRGAVAVLAMPWNLGTGLRVTAQTVSTMWHAAGDTSADMSWYTRRMTLAVVYTAVMAYWLSPAGPSIEQTLAFLDRRLQDIAPRRR